MPSRLDKDEKRLEEESSCQAQAMFQVVFTFIKYRNIVLLRGA
jgi:hypothetical protein